MSSNVKILGGGALALGGGALLLLGLFTVMFSIAWSNGSFGDVLLILLYILYVLPASVAMVMIGTWAISSANHNVRPSTQSQRKLGILLLLPAPVAAILLIWGYPDYRFWLYSATLGALLSLLAVAMFAAGIYCLKQAGSRGLATSAADPR